ncbi:hypothetical protein BM613_11970 [Sulfoacidibacillus thermotolerans]|uniref:HTH marR-type domain-containing protein n=2 Tax=Sulfoacidibacillus thermotolerans TaxID=1765684 RepID=A0A2U3D697_SULT2|nr:hypothetical protein BM613_11970 [Sulfoacidibacillus thermotolerans]
MRFRRLNWLNWNGTGPKPSDVRVLFCIKNHEGDHAMGMKLSEISQCLHVSPPTMTQLIKDLEEKGLVRRTVDHSDRRIIRIRLTAHGEKTVQQARETVAEAFQGLVDFLGEEKSRLFSSLLSEVVEFYTEHQTQLEREDH